MAIARRVLILIIVLISGFAPMLPASAQAADTKGEVAYLIDLVRHSSCTFIRNGSDYDGAAAADHIQQKYDYYKADIVTAEDFIDKAATKSMLSGKAYQVRCPGQAAEPSADWLRRELEAYRKQAP